MKFIQKRKIGIGYHKLLQIHKANGCYADTQNDNSKTPKVTTRTDILKDYYLNINLIKSLLKKS